jgi:hypothetical protein
MAANLVQLLDDHGSNQHARGETRSEAAASARIRRCLGYCCEQPAVMGAPYATSQWWNWHHANAFCRTDTTIRHPAGFTPCVRPELLLRSMRCALNSLGPSYKTLAYLVTGSRLCRSGGAGPAGYRFGRPSIRPCPLTSSNGRRMIFSVQNLHVPASPQVRGVSVCA